MFNELTEVDIRKMQEEIDYRMRVVRPKCVEDLKTARAFGDLSENYEYKAAKQELRRCDSRLRYLKKMIETAKVIKADSQADQVGLFDTVDVYFEDDDEVERLRIMTTLREDVLNGIISKESPMGKALMGRRVGDPFQIRRNVAADQDGAMLILHEFQQDVHQLAPCHGIQPAGRFVQK